MFSKRTEPAPRRPLSITTRLFLIYSISVYAMLVAATALLYSIVADGVERDDAFFAIDKVARIESILQQMPNDTTLLEHEVVWRGGLATMPHYSRILDLDGETVLESPSMEEVLPAGRFPSPIETGALSATRSLRHLASADGRTFCVLAARWSNPLTGEGGIIQVAMDDTDEHAFLGRLRIGTLVVLLFGTLFSAGLGHLAAVRGLRPLHDIAVAAERITASQLNERMDPARWPKELGTLALALNRMLGRLEEAFMRMSQCTAELAHELRTPIHNLMGEAGVALAARRSPEEYRRVLESSLEEYERLSRMINEMLFLARAENPRQQLSRERFDARLELEAVREFFDALSESRGVTVACQGGGEIEANPLLLRRALTNLLSNALRHTPHGGSVVLAVERPSAEETIIKVIDSGFGIPPEEAPRLFTRRCREPASQKLGVQGNGLGLSIVKSIVELHGGSLTLDSAPSRGTCVLMRFPQRPAPGAAARSRPRCALTSLTLQKM